MKSLLLSPSSGSTLVPNEWAVLLECASPTFDARRLIELSRSADWSRLLVLAEEHGVLSHLAARLCALESNHVPAEIRRTLVERHRAQVFSTLQMTAELFRVLDLFATKDILAVVVKGPVLAMQAYGDPTMRSYGDLDLLVRQRDIRRATESLQAMGYQATVPIAAIEAQKIPGQYLFSKPDSKLLIELHNDFTLRYYPRRLPIEKFFARRILVRLDAHEVPALAVEDELIFVCIHGAKHLWERLIWIADVAALVSRQTTIDWQSVAALAKEVGAERILHTGMLLAVDLLGLRLPDNISAVAKADAAAARLAVRVIGWLTAADFAPPGLFERAQFRMLMRGGLFSSPTYFLRLSLSPTEEDWGENTQGYQRWFFQPIRRLFRLARKYGHHRDA